MKILVVYATAGAGHRKAAEAIAHGFKSANSPHEVILTDSLDHTNPFFKKSYPTAYTLLITWVPALWGFFFGLLDIPALRPLVAVVRRIYNGLNAGGFQRYLVKENFDCIISTHFLGTEVSAALKRAGKITSRIITVVTDFDVHSIWLAKGVDHYTVASEWTEKKIMSLGVPKEKVSVTGIPTHENFSKPKNATELRAKMGLKTDRFTVLLATGSFGIGPIEEIITELKDFQVAVICGHNKKLFERLSALKSESAKIFGLVNNMDEMMGLSDVMITKPGGLSICEALVSGLPMIFFNAIPGQETNNIKVLASYGVGLSGITVSQMPAELQRLQSSPEEMSALKSRIKSLARPNAVKDIVGLASR
jgi:processive 1,2-diacylglycerol beta-glucosyltransferase